MPFSGYSSLCHEKYTLTLNEEMGSTGCWGVSAPAILIRERALYEKKMKHAAAFVRNVTQRPMYELPECRCPRSYSPERMVGPLVPCLVSTHRSSAVLTGLFTVTEHHVPRDGRAASFFFHFFSPAPLSYHYNGTDWIHCCIGSA